MKKIALFLLALSFIFSCAPTKKIERPLGFLSTNLYQYIKDTTFTCSDENIIELQRGLDFIVIPPKTQCAVYVDTNQFGRITARVYFGKDRNMKINGDPFLLYCPDESSGQLSLCDWSEHPDSVSYDSYKTNSGAQKFYRLNKGAGAKIMVDTTRNYFVLPGVRKTGSGKSPRT